MERRHRVKMHTVRRTHAPAQNPPLRHKDTGNAHHRFGFPKRIRPNGAPQRLATPMPERQRSKQKNKLFLTRSAALFAAFENSRVSSFFVCVAAFPRPGNLRTQAPAERHWLPQKQGPDAPEKQTTQLADLPRKRPFQATLEASPGSASPCGGRGLPAGRGDAGPPVRARQGAGGSVAQGCVRRDHKARCGMRNFGLGFAKKKQWQNSDTKNLPLVTFAAHL